TNAARGKITMPNTVRLHRVLPTRPEKVYRAFLEADALAKWLPPNGFTCTVHHFEPKVGGTFKMSFRNFTTGQIHSFGGEYVELVPNERLRYTDKFDDPNLDGDIEESIGRHRGEHRAGRPARRNPAGGLLSRLARVAEKPGKARRARNQSIAHRYLAIVEASRKPMRLLHTAEGKMDKAKGHAEDLADHVR